MVFEQQVIFRADFLSVISDLKAHDQGGARGQHLEHLLKAIIYFSDLQISYITFIRKHSHLGILYYSWQAATHQLQIPG